MSPSDLWSAGESLLASIPSLTGAAGPAGDDALVVFLACILALLLLGESVPHKNPCPGCWESDRDGCRDACSAYHSWKRRSGGRYL